MAAPGDSTGLGSRKNVFRITVVILYIALAIFLGVANSNHSPDSERYPGAAYEWDGVEGELPQERIVASNGDISYPIKLNGVECVLQDFLICDGVIDANGFPSAPKCCDALQDAGAHPGESITEPEAFLIGFIVPLVYLLLRVATFGRPKIDRCASLGCLSGDPSGPAWHDRAKFYSFDSILGFLASMILIGVVTEATKVAVSNPRRNYLALQYFALNSVAGQDDPDLQQRWLDASTVSWISGHSAFTMGPAIYLVLVMSADLRAFLGISRGALGSIVAAVAQVIFFLIIIGFGYVGITRLEDYWHRPIDVVSGWLAGGFLATYAWKSIALRPYEMDLRKGDSESHQHLEEGDEEAGKIASRSPRQAAAEETA